ncbi:MAG: methyltransferase domain-containing protein [Candidatus Omnitrophica bacterium]|nr:methyltransferase domain-containing protein [Candidatus Omnitrophota bacterium]
MEDLFDEHYLEYDKWYERNKNAYLSELEAIRKIIPRQGRGLEIGVGSGRFAAALGIDIGVDPSEKMIEIAGERGVETYKASGEKLPFNDSDFDYVAIIVTLCFVKDPRRVIQEASRVLKPGGSIVIGIIDKDSFLGKFYGEKSSIFYDRATFYGVDEVTRLLSESGFSRFSCYQTVFEMPDKLKSVDKPRKGHGRGGFVCIGGRKQ